MVLSWLSSYPLTVSSSYDFIFYHMNYLYWISLPLLLGSMFSIAAVFKNNYLKWIMCVGIVATFYSTSIFYSMMPGSDSQFFRGLNEYFIQTGNLDPTIHSYYQWPFFFLIFDAATKITGLPLIVFEYIIYAVIGFLLSTGLYVFVSRTYSKGAFLAVAGFFVAMFLFLNYQCVPFSLAISLLFLLFMIQAHKEKNLSLIVTSIILFVAISFTHSFTPVFFILYLLLHMIFERNSKDLGFFLSLLIVFVLVQVTIAVFSLTNLIQVFLSWSTEVSNIVDNTIVLSEQVVTPAIDDIAQIFSRFDTIAVIGLSALGFVILFLKRKLGKINLAIFFTGVFYFALGMVFYLLGSRAIPIAFIPVSLGLAYLYEVKYRSIKRLIPILTGIIIILFLFVPFHQMFAYSLQFQTSEAKSAENFFVQHYDWEKPRVIFMDLRATTYVTAKISFTYPYFDSHWETLDNAAVIFYTTALGKYFINWNSSLETILYDEKLNLVYDNGASYISTNPQK